MAVLQLDPDESSTKLNKIWWIRYIIPMLILAHGLLQNGRIWRDSSATTCWYKCETISRGHLWWRIICKGRACCPLLVEGLCLSHLMFLLSPPLGVCIKCFYRRQHFKVKVLSMTNMKNGNLRHIVDQTKIDVPPLFECCAGLGSSHLWWSGVGQTGDRSEWLVGNTATACAPPWAKGYMGLLLHFESSQVGVAPA